MQGWKSYVFRGVYLYDLCVEEISKIALRWPETVNSVTLGQPVMLLMQDIKADLLPRVG